MMRWLRSTAAVFFAMAAILALVPAGTAWAQQAGRMVQGKVEDSTGKPLSGAIAYLKDARTLDVKSYITEQDGEYRFDQLSPNDDYKLWAEMNEKKSGVKTISSFDSKKKLLINIHIDTAK